MKVDRFEDLIAWQKAVDLAVTVYDTAPMPRFRRDYAFADQLHRAAISVPANIAEGFERATRAEFHRFLTISKASCAELRSHLILASRIGYFDKTVAAAILSDAERVSQIVGKLRSSIQRARKAPTHCA